MAEIIRENESDRFNFWSDSLLLLLLLFRTTFRYCLSILHWEKRARKFRNEIFCCQWCFGLYAARTNFSHWKRNGCRQQKPHRKRTKTINNAGRFERIVFLLFLSSHFFFSPSILHPFTWLHKVSYVWWYTERLLTHSHSIIFLYIAKFRLTSMRSDIRLRLKRNRWKSKKKSNRKKYQRNCCCYYTKLLQQRTKDLEIDWFFSCATFIFSYVFLKLSNKIAEGKRSKY